jgi:hypothetical protein
VHVLERRGHAAELERRELLPRALERRERLPVGALLCILLPAADVETHGLNAMRSCEGKRGVHLGETSPRLHGGGRHNFEQRCTGDGGKVLDVPPLLLGAVHRAVQDAVDNDSTPVVLLQRVGDRLRAPHRPCPHEAAAVHALEVGADEVAAPSRAAFEEVVDLLRADEALIEGAYHDRVEQGRPRWLDSCGGRPIQMLPQAKLGRLGLRHDMKHCRARRLPAVVGGATAVARVAAEPLGRVHCVVLRRNFARQSATTTAWGLKHFDASPRRRQRH